MNILTRQMRKLLDRWYTAQEARGIIYEQQLKNGNIEKGSFKLTENGIKYSSLSSEERDLIRKEKYKNGKDEV